MKHLNKFELEIIYSLTMPNGSPIFDFEIIDRDKSFVLISKTTETKIRRCKIYIDHLGNEYIFPVGKYFNAPFLKASNIKIPEDDICPDPGEIDKEIFNQLY